MGEGVRVGVGGPEVFTLGSSGAKAVASVTP